jgi:hypothetical protein
MEGVESDRRRPFGVAGGAEPDQLVVRRDRRPPFPSALPSGC